MTLLVWLIVIGYLVAGWRWGAVPLARSMYEDAIRRAYHPDGHRRREERKFALGMSLFVIPVWPFYRVWLLMTETPVLTAVIPKDEVEHAAERKALERRIAELEADKARYERGS